MSENGRFVDIHCHVLPGLDDGAKAWSESLAMARQASADGIHAIVATPHQLGSHSGNDGPTIRAAAGRLQGLLADEQIEVRVFPGGDVRIEPDMIGKIRRGEVLTLADRGRHVLLELPHELYLPLDRLVAELKAAGLVGVLSHPERNQGILGRPEVVGPLVAAGCLMQVTAASVTGAFGSRSRTAALSWIKQGLVHFVATDAHGAKIRPPLLSAAFAEVAEAAGPETACELFSENPGRVVAGQDVPARRRVVRKTKWNGWFGSRRAG